MKVKIHYTLPRGKDVSKYTELKDSIIIEADTVEELQIMAEREISKRDASDPWSEMI